MVDTKSIDKDIVVCNIKNCLNCGNCVAACQRRHKDISRHRRAGSSLIGISLFPNLCRLCKEPKCIKACNRNGLEKDAEGHIVVTDNCVGCGMCIRACPYNAILLFSGDGKIRKKRKVVKCDGCAGYPNRACVINCPTGALEVLPIEEYMAKHKILFNIELRELLRQSLEEEEEEGHDNE
jgi:Fe-S-cluster-containing hydrogenase component 2